MNFYSANISEQQNIIDYKGALSYGIINQLLKRLKIEMDQLGEKLVTYKRILIIMVETLENASKYMHSIPGDVNLDSRFLPFFTLSRTNCSYNILSGNPVKNEHQAIIQQKIDQMNSLEPTELKKLYRKIISNGQFTREGGAGLGFIEIAKTSNGKIRCSFEKVNESYVFYTINIELTS